MSQRDTDVGGDTAEVSDSLSVTSVLGEAPAAVLLVDLVSRQVVHISAVGEQLAPGVALPVGLDEWSDAARLRDVSGNELSETNHPLSRVARSEPVAGQAVSAARRSDLGEGREALWVVALPMTGAPMLEDHALIALFPLTDTTSQNAAVAAAERGIQDRPVTHVGPRRAGDLVDPNTALRDRAVLATTLSFTVADALDPEQPLVWVNPAFTSTTGYEFDEVVGRNCRFLQGPATGPEGPGAMRTAIDAGVGVSTTLLNYRRDGTAFWNQVDISPVHDADGVVTHFVGIQTDVSTRIDADQARERALAAAQAARADAEAARAAAEAARGRLTFMVEAVNRLSGTLDVAECADRLLDLVLPDLADWALLFLVDERQRIVALTGRHRDPARQAEVDDYAAAFRAGMRPGSPAELLLAGKQVRLIEHLDDPASLTERAGYLRDMTVTERTAGLDGRSAMVVALPGRTTVGEVLVLVRSPHRAQFDDQDVSVGVDLGSRAGLIFDNARLFQAQHHIAETLQRSLLTDVPTIAGLDIAAHYRVGARQAQVGGDFYEVMPLPDDTIGIAIGDVEGHDVYAAAAMGRLKGMLRALAHTAPARDHSPAAVLDEVDQLITGPDTTTIATAIYGQLARTPSGWSFTWANAGHPPPVLRHPDGTVELLTAPERADLLLGVESVLRRDQHRPLAPGSTLFFYTDGLIEQRDIGLDEGFARLLETIAAAPPTAAEICRTVLAAGIAGPTEDDVAVIAMTVLAS